jgi:hypothetical protein
MVQAGTITILNGNFDAQNLSPGSSSGYPFGPITDWTENDVPFTVYSVYNPTTASYPGGVPGGANIAQVLGDGPPHTYPRPSAPPCKPTIATHSPVTPV